MLKNIFIPGLLTLILLSNCSDTNNITETPQEIKKDLVKDSTLKSNVKQDSIRQFNEIILQARAKIDSNKILIEDIKSSMEGKGKMEKDAYRKKVIILDAKNEDLIDKIRDYKIGDKAKREAFINDLNKDIEEIGKSLQYMSDKKKSNP